MNRSYKATIDKVIRVYNRYRSPEVTAKLIKIVNNLLYVKFIGSYCYTCGFYDYFDDFIIEADDLGVKIEIENITDMGDYAIVKFRIKGFKEIE